MFVGIDGGQIVVVELDTLRISRSLFSKKQPGREVVQVLLIGTQLFVALNSIDSEGRKLVGTIEIWAKEGKEFVGSVQNRENAAITCMALVNNLELIVCFVDNTLYAWDPKVWSAPPRIEKFTNFSIKSILTNVSDCDFCACTSENIVQLYTIHTKFQQNNINNNNNNNNNNHHMHVSLE